MTGTVKQAPGISAGVVHYNMEAYGEGQELPDGANMWGCT